MSTIRYVFASIQRDKRYLLSLTLILLGIVIASCGGGFATTGGNGATSTSAGSSSTSNGAGSGSSGNAPSSKSSSQGQQDAQDAPAQYLIKTLKVNMSVKDTAKTADALQNWITTTDTKASSAGITYDQAGDNLYNISLTFQVQSTLYPQIQRYLRDYAPQHNGQLLSLNESVQDVTNDYIDTQSRLTNLRSEQTRLLTLLSHANALGDIITIQDKLTDIEGQIETIEAHLKQLNGQVSFYTISITLQPIVLTPPSPSAPGWSIGQTFHDAFAASLGFAQGLFTFLVWLLAFAVYLVPAAALLWFFWRWRKRSFITSTPAPAPNVPTGTPPTVS